MYNKGNTRKGKYRNGKSKIGDKGREVLQQIDDSNPVMVMFHSYATELDAKHDRHERIVKLSRDVTIESKRIIFSLHNIAVDIESKKLQILSDANVRLQQLIDNSFKAIALELEGQDTYLYQRAYTAGLQEFVEAHLYYQYLNSGCIEPMVNLEQKFSYTIPTGSELESTADGELVENLVVTNRNVKMFIPMQDFFLGLADFTGELMRRCINNLSSGNLQDCFRICNFVRTIYMGFLGVSAAGKELGRKIFVLKQSVLKMEHVCYNIQVRGSEIPKHMLASVITNDASEINQDEDEGFY